MIEAGSGGKTSLQMNEETCERVISWRMWQRVHTDAATTDSIVCRLSSVVRRPSSVVRRPSSVVRRPSSVVCRLSSVVRSQVQGRKFSILAGEVKSLVSRFRRAPYEATELSTTAWGP